MSIFFISIVVYKQDCIGWSWEAQNNLIMPNLGLKGMKTVYGTMKGVGLMRMFKKGLMKVWYYGQGIMGEGCVMVRRFGICYVLKGPAPCIGDWLLDSIFGIFVSSPRTFYLA